jgi:aminomethyltransferase
MASPSSLLRTPLNDVHRELGARMVDFAGWDMPVQYPSGILAEHQAVRQACGLFDLSHMGRVYLRGSDALALAQECCTRDLSRIAAGEAAYSVLCEEDGGIVDDVIAYVLGADEVLFVFNASNRETDVAFFEAHIDILDVRLHDATFETALIGVQGPSAQSMLQPLCDLALDAMTGYTFAQARVADSEALVARTGYTGEDGFELMMGAADAARVWRALCAANAVPCGLGARDTLRTEAGFALYGHEIDRSTNPYEARLGWVVNLPKPHFVGREALARIKASGPQRKLVGLRVAAGPVPRPGAPILPAGIVTSGTFSPTLRANIAMGYIPIGNTDRLQVEVRGKPLDAEVVPLPFVPHRSRPRSTMKS